MCPPNQAASSLHNWQLSRRGIQLNANQTCLPSGLGWHTFRHTYRALLDETGAPVGVQQKLMRHSNVATTMNIYGNATMRAKQQANSKVVQMVMKQEKRPQAVQEQVAVAV